MATIYKHPLYAAADSLKRTFAAFGYTLYDLGVDPEVEPTGQTYACFSEPEAMQSSPIDLEGNYSLRTRLLPAQLPKMPRTLPLRAAVCGRIYDAKEGLNCSRIRFEGVFADTAISKADLDAFWDKIVAEVLGLGNTVELVPEGNAFRIAVRKGSDDFTFGYFGPLSWLASSVLGTAVAGADAYAFCIDVDDLAGYKYGLKDRAALYDPLASSLKQWECDSPAYGETFIAKVENVMRELGFLEFSGAKLYEEDAYVKMNMIQEAWDKNNVGVKLKEPLDGRSGLPTVLAPALEEALSANFQAGEKAVRLFEVGHIFLPGPGGVPVEKMSVSAGVYEPEMDINKFTGIADTMLSKLGIQNHFFFPTDIAIAYNIRETRILLDEKMSYLGGNFGGISQKAEANHGIGTHAFMIQFELPQLEAKAAEEYGFIPPEET